MAKTGNFLLFAGCFALIAYRLYFLVNSGFFEFVLTQFVSHPILYTPGEVMKISSLSNAPKAHSNESNDEKQAEIIAGISFTESTGSL